MELTLICWACGRKKHLQVPELPLSVFHFLDIVREEGWTAILDTDRSRTLALCSQECVEASKTKDGRIRARSPKLKAKEA